MLRVVLLEGVLDVIQYFVYVRKLHLREFG